jgi:hypothetical protein
MYCWGARRSLARRRRLDLLPRAVGLLVRPLVLPIAHAVRVMDLVSARIRERIV